MSTDNNSNAKSEMWSEAKNSEENILLGTGDESKELLVKSVNINLLTREARDAYIEENLGHRYIRYSRD